VAGLSGAWESPRSDSLDTPYTQFSLAPMSDDPGIPRFFLLLSFLFLKFLTVSTASLLRAGHGGSAWIYDHQLFRPQATGNHNPFSAVSSSLVTLPRLCPRSNYRLLERTPRRGMYLVLVWGGVWGQDSFFSTCHDILKIF